MTAEWSPLTIAHHTISCSPIICCPGCLLLTHKGLQLPLNSLELAAGSTAGHSPATRHQHAHLWPPSHDLALSVRPKGGLGLTTQIDEQAEF